MKIPVIATLMLLAPAAFAPDVLAHGPETHETGIGQPGEPGGKLRTVAIEMNDSMRFAPATVAVKAGETIRFAIRNAGTTPHEFMLGKIADLRHHAELMRKHPEMVHDEPNAVTLQPGESGEVIWRFPQSGQVDFACLVPGHFEAGMRGQVQVRQ